MEACGSAHHWARWLNRLGIEVRLLALQAKDGLAENEKSLKDAEARFNNVFTTNFCFKVRDEIRQGGITLQRLNKELKNIQFGYDTYELEFSWIPRLQKVYEFFEAAESLADSGATAQQRQALEQIGRGKAGGGIFALFGEELVTEWPETKIAAIEFEMQDGTGRVEIEGYGAATSELLAYPDGTIIRPPRFGSHRTAVSSDLRETIRAPKATTGCIAAYNAVKVPHGEAGPSRRVRRTKLVQRGREQVGGRMRVGHLACRARSARSARTGERALSQPALAIEGSVAETEEMGAARAVEPLLQEHCRLVHAHLDLEDTLLRSQTVVDGRGMGGRGVVDLRSDGAAHGSRFRR